jgi:hypothetical protein
MAASTDIKFYVHTNNNAPQLQNAYGSMIGVLDACLVDGIFIGNIASLTVSGLIATAIFTTPHNLMQYQVLKVAGANQSEFNKEFKVLTVPNPTTVSFRLDVAASVNTATGTITASLPSLGWEKSFSSSHAISGGRAAYQPTELLVSSCPFLRVVDEPDPTLTVGAAKYAKVGIVESMSGIDSMLGMQAPYDASKPTKNWIGDSAGNGWAVWAYALASNENTFSTITSAPPSGPREWFVLGGKDFVYVLPRFHIDPSTKNRLCPYFFGNTGSGFVLLHSVIDGNSITPWSAAILANLNNVSGAFGGSALISNNDSLNAMSVKTFTLFYSLTTSNGAVASGYTSNFSAQFGSEIFTTDIFSLDQNGRPFGKFPCCEFIHALRPYAHLLTFNEGVEMKIAVNCIAYEQGEVLFSLGEL